MKNSKLLLTIIVALVLTNLSFSQSDSVSIFDELANKVWVGHYVGSEDSNMVHNIHFSFLLQNKAVKEIKKVPEVNFNMETYYYWDWKEKQISFLSLINKDMISKGTVTQSNGKITLVGQTYFEGGIADFRKTFHINEDGKLIDCFYRKKKTGWVQGHLIEYVKGESKNE